MTTMTMTYRIRAGVVAGGEVELGLRIRVHYAMFKVLQPVADIVYQLDFWHNWSER